MLGGKVKMSVFYVYQGVTYEEERLGGYVWAPKLNKAGKKNAGYTMMTNIRKFDFILHNMDGKIMAISIAQTDCYDGKKPAALRNPDLPIQWDEDGYQVDTKYFDLDVPLLVINHKEWLGTHYKSNSAFTVKGTGKQQYMCEIDNEHAIYLLERAISLQTNPVTIKTLQAALSEITAEKDSEYSSNEMDEIYQCIELQDNDSIPEWKGIKSKQDTVITTGSEREMPKRNPQVAADALAHAEYKCEFSEGDRTFLRKNGRPYTEPHHLIPISKYRNFEYSVDVMENIVSLCSHCHNLLHYGRFEDKVVLLKKLYDDRKVALEMVGLNISFEQLTEYYK